MKARTLLLARSAAPALMLAAPGAFAQSAPVPAPPYNIGDAVRQADEARRAEPPRAAVAPVLPQLVEPRLILSAKETLFVRAFDVEGRRPEDEAELAELLAPYENRKLNLAQIYEAADKVSAYYRGKGYILAKAYVPAQDARGKALRVKLLLGARGSVTVRNQSYVSDEHLQDLVDETLSVSPLVEKESLERAMLLVSDLPGAGTPRIVVAPGQAQGTSDLVFDVPEGRQFDGYLFGDNVGSPYTGRDRLNGGLSLNSPLGIGDKLSLSGIVSERAGLANGRVAYAFPLGHDLRAEIGAFRTTYALGGVYKDLNATGRAESVTATLTYAAERSREESIYLWTNFTHKWLTDKILDVSTAARTIALGSIGVTRESMGALFDLPLATSSTFSFTGGNVTISDPLLRAANIAGANSVGAYYKLNLSVNATLALSESVSFATWLRAQKGLNRNLDTSEQFSLAGFYGVRSFDEGLSGDSGYIVTPELKVALPQVEDYRHSFSIFTDLGGAWLEDGSYTALQRSYTGVRDAGLGYNATYEYSSGRFLVLKAQAVHSYGSNSGSRLYDRHTKGLVQIGFTF